MDLKLIKTTSYTNNDINEYSRMFKSYSADYLLGKLFDFNAMRNVELIELTDSFYHPNKLYGLSNYVNIFAEIGRQLWIDGEQSGLSKRFVMELTLNALDILEGGSVLDYRIEQTKQAGCRYVLNVSVLYDMDKARHLVNEPMHYIDNDRRIIDTVANSNKELANDYVKIALEYLKVNQSKTDILVKSDYLRTVAKEKYLPKAKSCYDFTTKI